MSLSMFDTLLSTPEMAAVFDDAALIHAMLRFEQELAAAQAAEGLIPATAATAIAGVCSMHLYDIPAIIHRARQAGSVAIPLVKELTSTVALYSPESATHVHWGSTSQDVIDSAYALATRHAVELLDAGIAALAGHLLQLARKHLATPVLARTLMQPAQVTSFGAKLVGWAAPLLRARAQLRSAAERALQLQLGGAVGTLAVMGEQGPAVARRMAAALGLTQAAAPWHTQRDEWMRLGMEVAILTGSLGKIATDLALMAQGEVGELAEPSGAGRGGSSAMPHKRNPVSALTALGAATRMPQQAAALLACMAQQHERGLGNWQAELAEWPSLFLGAHGALRALEQAFGGLQVDSARMRANIDALHGLVFAEAAAQWLAVAIGRPAAHALLERLSRQAADEQRHLSLILAEAVQVDPALDERVDPLALRMLFDPVAATVPAQRIAGEQLEELEHALETNTSPRRPS